VEAQPTPQAFTPVGLDALPPAEIARKAAAVGEAKVAMPHLGVFVLAVLAGAFIALGAVFATTVMTGARSCRSASRGCSGGLPSRSG
jgi:formate transporter